MKRIFKTLGGLTMIMVVAFSILGIKALSVSGDNTKSAVIAVETLSKDWRIEKHNQHVDPALLKIADAPNVKHAFNVFKRYGSLVRSEGATQSTFKMSTETGTTAVIKFTGHFQNGTAKVTVKLRNNDGQMKIYGLNLDGSLKSKKQQQA